MTAEIITLTTEINFIWWRQLQKHKANTSYDEMLEVFPLRLGRKQRGWLAPESTAYLGQ